MKDLIGHGVTVGGRKLEAARSPYPHMREINVLGADFFSKYHLYIVLDTSRLEPSRDLCSSMLGSRHPLARRLEPGETLARVAKIFEYA